VRPDFGRRPKTERGPSSRARRIASSDRRRAVRGHPWIAKRKGNVGEFHRPFGSLDEDRSAIESNMHAETQSNVCASELLFSFRLALRALRNSALEPDENGRRLPCRIESSRA
jgi:hypothetical protein